MRTERFTFLCTAQEKHALERLAVLWRRSKSDTVRLLILSALEQLFTAEQEQQSNGGKETAAPKARSTEGGEHGGRQ